MKIFVAAFRPDGEMIAEKEITRDDLVARANRRTWERQMEIANPGCHFRMSCLPEETDGPHYENVPDWKVKAAAEILDSRVQQDLRNKVHSDLQIAPTNFQTTH